MDKLKNSKFYNDLIYIIINLFLMFSFHNLIADQIF